MIFPKACPVKKKVLFKTYFQFISSHPNWYPNLQNRQVHRSEGTTQVIQQLNPLFSAVSTSIEKSLVWLIIGQSVLLEKHEIQLISNWKFQRFINNYIQCFFQVLASVWTARQEQFINLVISKCPGCTGCLLVQLTRFYTVKLY